MILIFDYDGTCHDAAGTYCQAVRDTVPYLLEKGYTPARPLDNETLSKYLGMNAPDMWKDFVPDAPQTIAKEGAKLVGKAISDAATNGKARLFLGVEDLFKMLKEGGNTLLMLSNCPENYRDAHWEAFGLSRYFSKFYASGAYGEIPKEEIFLTIKKEFPGEYCMIGDRYSDLKVGFVHGFTTIACHYGYGSDEELKNADYHAHSIEELTQIMKELFVLGSFSADVLGAGSGSGN